MKKYLLHEYSKIFTFKKTEEFDFVEGEDLSELEIQRLQKDLKGHRRRVSVFFRNSQIILAIAVGLKAGMYAVFVQQTFGFQGAATLQAIYHATYFLLNIPFGILADSRLGRRKVYLFGTTMFLFSYLLYGIGTWTTSVLAEITFGIAGACVSGVLGVWYRNIIENTYHLKAKLQNRNKEGIDTALIELESNNFCRKSAKEVFGFISVFMFATGTAGGFLATSWNPAGVWLVGAGICALLVGYVWWHMYHQTIPIQVQSKLPWKEILVASWVTLRKEKSVRSFVLIGLSFATIAQVVKLIWVPITEPIALIHHIPIWVVTAATILFSVIGGMFVVMFEKTNNYKRRNDEGQTRMEFLVLKSSIVLIGVLMICTKFIDGLLVAGIILSIFTTAGIFGRVHAGSIAGSIPNKLRRQYGTTMLSIYETRVALAGLLISLSIMLAIKHYDWQPTTVALLTGILAIVLGLSQRLKTS